MLMALLIPAVVLILVAVAAFPKTAFYLIWIVLCTFPHGLWESLGVPLNIGFDDLLTVYLLMVVIARKGFHLSRAHTLMILYFLAICLGNATGHIFYGDQIMGVSKILLIEVLKCSTFIMLAIAINELIENERDLRHAWMGMVVGLGTGALLALYSYYDPGIMIYFGTKRGVTLAEWGTAIGGYRAAGAFTEPATAALSMMLGLAMILWAWYQYTDWRRLLLIGCALLFAAVAFLTGTRTVLLAFVMLMAAFPLLRGSRFALVGISIGGVLLLLVDPTLIATLHDRLYTLQSGRLEIWKLYLGSLDVQRLFLGQGQWPGIINDGAGFQGHNVFIDMLCYYGIWGLLAGTGLFVFYIRRLAWLRKIPHPMAIRLYGSALAFLIFFLTFGMTGDTMTPQSWGLRIFFVMMVFLDAGAQVFASAAEPAASAPDEAAYMQTGRLAGGAW